MKIVVLDADAFGKYVDYGNLELLGEVKIYDHSGPEEIPE